MPLASFVALRGHCASCKAPISWQYPLVEAASALTVGVVTWIWGPTVHALVWLCFLLVSLTLCVSDIRWLLLPDRLTLALVWFGLMANSFQVWVPLTSAVWGAAVGYVLLWSVNALYWVLRRRDGMGGGDQKLFAALGACFGLDSLWPTLLLASFSGAIAALMYRAIKGRVPVVIFGPWLLAAALAWQWLAPWLVLF